MDRNIPHIRDIFSSSSRKKSGDFQDLCVYERSPRSRRRAKNFESSPEFDQADNKTSSPRKRNEKGKENHKTKNCDEARLLPENNKNNSNTNQYGNKQYSSKTLTERDIRHLERHLSMKKTIRKQISRNLAQAFVDNPNLFEPGPKRDSAKPDYSATLSKAKLAKSEQNVLDMLKISIEERDSGHSSPTNEVLSREEDEDDYDENFDNVDDSKSWSRGHRNSETKLLNNDVVDNKGYNNDKKSIWKMFSTRNKGKR